MQLDVTPDLSHAAKRFVIWGVGVSVFKMERPWRPALRYAQTSAGFEFFQVSHVAQTTEKINFSAPGGPGKQPIRVS